MPRILSITLIIILIVADIALASDGAKKSTAARPVGGTREMCTYTSNEAKLGQYQAVLLENAVIDTTARKTEKTTAFLNELRGIINSTIEKSLKDTGRFQLVTAKKSDIPPNAKYLVCRSDSAVNYSNFKEARFMAGYGAGNSRILMVISLEEPESGEIVLKFTGWGNMYEDFGQSTLEKLSVDITDISGYFAGLIKRLPD